MTIGRWRLWMVWKTNFVSSKYREVCSKSNQNGKLIDQLHSALILVMGTRFYYFSSSWWVLKKAHMHKSIFIYTSAYQPRVILAPADLCQCLDTLPMTAMIWGHRSCSWHLVGRGVLPNILQCPGQHLWQRIIQFQMSTVLGLKTLVSNMYFTCLRSCRWFHGL